MTRKSLRERLVNLGKSIAFGGNRKEQMQKNETITISPPFIQGVKKLSEPIHADDIDKISKFDMFVEDPEILKLMYIMLNRTPQNKRWCYNNDNSLKSAGFILANAIVGATGLEVKSVDDDIKNKLTSYFKFINVSKIIQRSIKDQVCFADSVFWKYYDFEKQTIIPQWIDYITLKRIKNSYNGKTKWIQVAYVDEYMPTKDGKQWKDYEPYIDYFNNTSEDTTVQTKTKMVKSHLLEENVLNFNFFSSPLIDTVIETVIWKKWMQFDAKLGGQKYSTPLIDAQVERPENIDLSSEEEDTLMLQIASDLNRMMSFGVLAHNKAITLQSINQQGQVFQFVQYLEYADKQIHRAVLLPVNLLEASGTELATSRTTKDMFNIVINALRKQYIDVFTDLALEYLYFIGMDVSENDFVLTFSEDDVQQQLTQNEEFNAVMQLYDRGIMRDENEVRKYISKFGMEMEQLTDEEIMLKSQEELQQTLIEQDFEMKKIEEQNKLKAQQVQQIQTKAKSEEKNG